MLVVSPRTISYVPCSSSAFAAFSPPLLLLLPRFSFFRLMSRTTSLPPCRRRSCARRTTDVASSIRPTSSTTSLGCTVFRMVLVYPAVLATQKTWTGDRFRTRERQARDAEPEAVAEVASVVAEVAEDDVPEAEGELDAPWRISVHAAMPRPAPMPMRPAAARGETELMSGGDWRSSLAGELGERRACGSCGA